MANIDWSSGIASGISGLLSLGGNMITSAINSGRAWKYTRRAMEFQDQLNRAYTRDSYGIMRQGLQQAGYNPLLALGSSANSSVYSGAGINSDSDAGDQAVNSAINALSAKANIKNVKAQTDKVEEEKKGVELDNRLKRKQLNTDPKAIISDLVEGNDTPVTKAIKKIFPKIGNTLGVGSSARSNSAPVIIKLHNGKPVVGKNVPRSVVKTFEKMSKQPNSAMSQKKNDETIGIWNSNKRVSGRVLSDDEAKRYLKRKINRTYNKPPRTIPY